MVAMHGMCPADMLLVCYCLLFLFVFCAVCVMAVRCVRWCCVRGWPSFLQQHRTLASAPSVCHR